MVGWMGGAAGQGRVQEAGRHSEKEAGDGEGWQQQQRRRERQGQGKQRQGRKSLRNIDGHGYFFTTCFTKFLAGFIRGRL